MPVSGGRLCLSFTLAVAKPSSRPSFLPWTTRPLMLYGRPSSASAAASSPPASAARTAELDTRVPARVTTGMVSTSYPQRPPSVFKSGRSPARFAPNRKSSPTRIQRALSRFASTCSTKLVGAIAANDRTKRSTWMRSTPRSASNSNFSRSEVRRVGAVDGEKNSRGWGSNVSTQLTRPRLRASPVRRASIAWCPRWIPSKLPIVSATGGSVASEAPWVSSMKPENKRKILNYSGFPSTPNSGNGFGAPQRRIRAGTRRNMSGKRTDNQVKSLDEQMAIYAAYHRNRWNRLTHFIGVPAIVFAILIPMSWVPLAAGSGVASGWIWFGASFVGGWIFQLAGHAFEGRRPALADNLFQIFVAPIFLMAEVFFALGLKREVLKKVEARLAQSPSAK